MAKLDAATLRVLAVASDADPRTVQKYIAGQAIKGAVRFRIERALRRRGLEVLPPAFWVPKEKR